MVNKVLGNSELASRDFARAMKYDKVNASRFLKDKKDVYLEVFPQ
jgi:hypothetical protein